jgi:hypothetical protein
MWPSPVPPPETWLQRVWRQARQLGIFGVSGLGIFALILLWSARDWFGIY